MLLIVLELIAALLGFPADAPICVAVGQGVFCAPVKVRLSCMSPVIDRPGWWDRHQQVGCPGPMQMVVVISETTRAEAPAEP